MTPAKKDSEVKGPDPAQWPVESRDRKAEPRYRDAKVKGPDPAVWGAQEEVS